MMGEYERTSTAVINAVLSPGIVSYLRDLDIKLRDLGLSKSILLVQSNGGAISNDQVTPRPVNLLLSGPAAAVGALNTYRQIIDHMGARHPMTQETLSRWNGGTSCDVMLMSGGNVAMKDDLMIAGYHVSIPAIDIHTVGAGGGTIAETDGAGMLFVGLKAPAPIQVPPAMALVVQNRPTDAQLVLGRLRAGAYSRAASRLI